MSPIQSSFIARDLLTPEEVQWVNDYNLEVRDKLIPLLQDDQKTIKWLNDNTQAV
jgi:Xaa-Pro aminopeptidase